MLTWNVYIEDINKRCIEVHNIFNHSRFVDDLKKARNKFKDDKEGFTEQLRRELMYYYWSKCEWEVIITSWPPPRPDSEFDDMKIDVYDQILLNWRVFVDYVWEHRKEL